MNLSWLHRSWNERQLMKTEDLSDELTSALAWGGEALDVGEPRPEDPTASDAVALASAENVAPGAAELDPATSDIMDALLAVLQEADALPDSAVNRLASTVDAVAAHELVSHVRGLRHRLDI